MTQYTFCNVTSGASEVLRELHERTLMVVPEEHWLNWLLADADPEVLKAVLKPGCAGHPHRSTGQQLRESPRERGEGVRKT